MSRSPLEKFVDIRPGDVLTFIGGGGKSTLIHSIAAKLAKEQRTVITTATRTFLPERGDSPYLFFTDERPIGELLPNLSEHGTVTVSPERLWDGRLAGYPPEEVDTFADLSDYLLIESEDAEGASLPPAAPQWEPRPVPPITTVLCAVAGLDALGDALDCRGFAERLVAPGGILDRPPRLERTVLFLHKADRRSIQKDGGRICGHLREILGPVRDEIRVLLTSERTVMRRL